jgi:hypothetical protein
VSFEPFEDSRKNECNFSSLEASTEVYPGDGGKLNAKIALVAYIGLDDEFAIDCELFELWVGKERWQSAHVNAAQGDAAD